MINFFGRKIRERNMDDDTGDNYAPFKVKASRVGSWGNSISGSMTRIIKKHDTYCSLYIPKKYKKKLSIEEKGNLL